MNDLTHSAPAPLPISVVIPTYRREQVLIDTIGYLLSAEQRAAEIIVVDQTERHDTETDMALAAFEASGDIRWLRLPEPSITAAMNQGLCRATQPIVLYVDDDVRPEASLLAAHLDAHARMDNIIVAGRVIQPWEEGLDSANLLPGSFAGTNSGWVSDFIGCNFSVKRSAALAAGGFDENFVRVAYRYEAEFAHRFQQVQGGRVWFEASACLHHLKKVEGGTRSYGHHLTTWRPDHAVGAYYFALRSRRWLDLVRRPLRAVATRHHLGRPWQIPRTWFAEMRGLAWAIRLYRRGPRLLAKGMRLADSGSSSYG